MNNAKRTVMAVLCAASFAGTWVSAQEETPAPAAPATDLRNSDVKSGDLQSESQGPFRLSAELRGFYTDNRDATESDKQSTFDFFVTPRLSIGFSADSGSLDFQYAPSFRYRTDPSDIQNDFVMLHSLQFKGELVANPEVRLRVRENFDYSDDPSVDEQGVTIRENRTYILNRVEGGVNWRFIRWSDLDVYVRDMIKRYDKADAATDSDRDALETGVALWRQVARTVGVQLIGKMTAFGFESGNNVNRDFDLYFGGVRVEKKLNPTLRGAVTVGYESAEYADNNVESSSSPFGQVEAHGDLLRVLHLTAALTHGIREADVYPFASQEYNQIGGRVAWDAPQAVTLGVNATYRLSTYDADEVPSGATAADYTKARSGDETTIVVGVDATIKLGEKSAITLAQTYEDIDSDVYVSFKKNTTSAGLTVSF